MEILRVPPYSTDAKIAVGNPAQIYSYSIIDMADHFVTEGEALSDNKSKVTIPLPSEYDNSYTVLIDGQELYFDVVRPYSDPTKKGKTASEIAEYAKNEELARAIIDSIVDSGFYFKKEVVQMTGLGADYLPVWKRAQRLLRLYENNVKVFDIEDATEPEISYALSEDKTAITLTYPGPINKAEGAPLLLPQTRSDMLDIVYGYRGFPRNYDYVATLEAGYKSIPSDIIRATELLVEDISCGKLEYFKRYISDYNTDQFKIKFDKAMFEGTGNLIVDKILSKYRNDIDIVGVL
jgi:hypothetical protein